MADQRPIQPGSRDSARGARDPRHPASLGPETALGDRQLCGFRTALDSCAAAPCACCDCGRQNNKRDRGFFCPVRREPSEKPPQISRMETDSDLSAPLAAGVFQYLRSINPLKMELGCDTTNGSK